MEFIGRKVELQSLMNTARLGKSSLVVCRGRRRIGKSRLINEFANRANFEIFLEVQGLAPAPGQTLEDQLENFMRAVCRTLDLPPITATDWSHAFELLYSFLKQRRALIFLDEISWMSFGDSNFTSKLKIAWDTLFSRSPEIMVVLCGSITSWIDQNILKNTNFVGRVSLTITLRELPLPDLKEFMASKQLSNFEALKILAVTGGVPRYLEEIDHRVDAETNIKRMCFLKEGLLFDEFHKIFDDIFDKRAATYLRIIEVLVSGALSSSEIAKKMSVPQSGVLTEYINDLVESGFLRKSYTWNLKTSNSSKLSKVAISDNYIRFYLKFIKPRRAQIQQDLYASIGSGIPIDNVQSILGLQLESLLLNNIKAIIELLHIRPDSVVNFGPYFQTKTQRRDATQIDLLIQTKTSYYICEIKFKQNLNSAVTHEMQSKISKLKLAPHLNVKTVLFFVGNCSKDLLDSDYWTHKFEVPRAFWE